MNNNYRRALSILSIGGGYLGVVISLSNLWAVSGFFTSLFVLCFVGLYLFGIVSGTFLLESGSLKAIRLNYIYWMLQVPVLMSPILGYQFSSGLVLNIWLGSFDGFGWNISLGSSFRYSMFESYQPWLMGINIIALAITLSLRKIISSIKNEQYDRVAQC